MKVIKIIILLQLASLFSSTVYAVELLTKKDYEKNVLGLFAKNIFITEALIKAKHGDARAQYYQGVIDSGGNQIFLIPTKNGVSWFRKAANQGYIDAYMGLAIAYKKGQGVKKSSIQSESWYKKAFVGYKKLGQQNDKEAQYMLAEFFAEGLGIEKNQKKALDWLKKSSAQQYPEAILAMARFHVGHYFSVLEYDSDLDKQKIFTLGMRYYSQSGIDNQEEAKKVKQEVQESMAEAQAFINKKKMGKAYDALTIAKNSNYMPSYHMSAAIILGGYTPTYIKNAEDKIAEIIRLLKRPAEAGMPASQFELAKMYFQKGDAEEASKWFYKIGEGGIRARNKDAVNAAIQGLNGIVQKFHLNQAKSMVKELRQLSKRL